MDRFMDAASRHLGTLAVGIALLFVIGATGTHVEAMPSECFRGDCSTAYVAIVFGR